MDSAEIRAALQCSRYNETVVVKVEDPSDASNQREILLIPCLDEENGGIIWNEYKHIGGGGKEDPEIELDIGVVRHLRTKRWFFPMLNDSRRNELYEEAIQRASKALVRSPALTFPIRALDIGSGTGLLAMMAAKFLEKALIEAGMEQVTTIHVTSLEMSSAMCRLARLTVADNQMQDKVTILENHSTDDLTEYFGGQHQVSFCVSELLESSLLAEGILPALRDAWNRHLRPDAVIVPQRARVFCQLVEGPFLHSYWGPHSQPSGDGSALRLCLSARAKDRLLNGGARGGFVLPIHAEHWVDESLPNAKDKTASGNQKLRPLTHSLEVMDFDFSRPGKLPGSEGRTRATKIIPHSTGRVHAVLFWWELDLWDDCTYSTQAGHEPWQDHWHQCLYIFAQEEDGAAPDGPEQYGYQINAGEQCELIASHSDTALWFSMRRTKDSLRDKSQDSDEHRIKRTKLHTAGNDEVSHVPSTAEVNAELDPISPYRAWQLNDEERKLFLRRGIEAALEMKGKDAIVLDVSDFSLCAIMAALEGASRVTSLESSSGVVPSLSARVAQLANNLPRKNIIDALFQVIQCHVEHLSLKLLNAEDVAEDGKLDPVEILLAEPYYEMLEGWHLLEALNFLYLARSLRRRGILSESACVVPRVGIIKGCAIQSFQLKEAYSRCGPPQTCCSDREGNRESICGFDHTRSNLHGDRFDCYDLSLPVWQYDYVELTDRFDIAKLYYDSTSTETETAIQVPFKRPGTCHAILVWIEYATAPVKPNYVTSANGASAPVDSHSNLGRSYQQLIRMLPEAYLLKNDGLEDHEFACHFALGGRNDLESYTFDLRVQKVI